MSIGLATKSDYTPSNARLAIILIILGAGYFFSYFHRMSLAVLAHDISAEFALSAVGLGILGSAYFYPYAAMQIPCGFIVDRLGTKITISASLLLVGLGSFWFGLSDTFNSLVVSRTLIGLGVACIYVPALKTIKEWFPPEKFGFFTGLIFAMGTLGGLCASAPLTFIAKSHGWRSVFFVIGLLTLFLGLTAWFFLLGRRKSGSDAPALSESSPAKTQKGIYTLSFMALTVWFFCLGGTKLSFQSLWAAPYLTNTFGFSKEFVGFSLMALALGNVFSGPVVGFLADRLGTRRTFIAANAAVALFWLCLALWKGGASLQLVLPCYFLLGFSGGGALISGFTMVGSYAKKENSGAVLSIVNCAALLGSAIFTQGSGNVVAALGPTYSYQVLYYAFFTLIAVCSLWVYFSTRAK